MPIYFESGSEFYTATLSIDKYNLSGYNGANNDATDNKLA